MRIMLVGRVAGGLANPTLRINTMKWQKVAKGYYIAFGEEGRVYHTIKSEHVGRWTIDGFQYLESQFIIDAANTLKEAKQMCRIEEESIRNNSR